jgi:hypothetical protein
MKFFYPFILLIVLNLNGCGSVQRQQEAAQFATFSGPESGSSVLIVPVGITQAQSSSSKGGAALGLIGVLIEAAELLSI